MLPLRAVNEASPKSGDPSATQYACGLGPQGDYIEMEQFADALGFTEQALSFALQNEPFDSAEYIRILRSIAHLHRQLGDEEKELEYAEKALAAHAKYLGKENHEYIREIRLFVLFQGALEEEKAISLLLEAWAIEEKIGAESHGEKFRAASTICRYMDSLERYSDMPPFLTQWTQMARSEYRLEPIKLAKQLILVSRYHVSLGNENEVNAVLNEAEQLIESHPPESFKELKQLQHFLERGRQMLKKAER